MTTLLFIVNSNIFKQTSILRSLFNEKSDKEIIVIQFRILCSQTIQVQQDTIAHYFMTNQTLLINSW